MRRQQLNALVADYRQGNESALNELFKAAMPFIEKASEHVDRITGRGATFDCRMLQKIEKRLDTFDSRKHDYIALVKALISEEQSDFLKRRRRMLEEISVQQLEYQTGARQGSETAAVFEIEDKAGGDAEDALLYKETIALLAQGDRRREIILDQWAKGASDLAISKLLAQLFGGDSESHRRFILRYRERCQKALT